MHWLCQRSVVRFCMAFSIAAGLTCLLVGAAERDTPDARNPPAVDPDPLEGRRPAARKPAEPPTIVGTVAAYDVDTSLTVAVRVRGGKTREEEYRIVKDRTRIEFPKDVKAPAVGMSVSIWTDKEAPKVAVRIVAGDTAAPVAPAGRRKNSEAAAAAPAAAPAVPRLPRVPRRPVSGLSSSSVAREIDEQVDARLGAANLPASPPCDDAEFLRRVTLDIVGVIPRADEATAFLDSQDPEKRARLIDALLASPEYGRHFAEAWCERIVSRDLPVEKEPFLRWLADDLNDARGWNAIVFDQLTAGGEFKVPGRGNRAAPKDPEAMFLLVNTEGSNSVPAEPRPQWLAAESAKLFLGVQLQCAECHDHPFTNWKQSDFWGLAAFFGRLRVERSPYRWVESAAPTDAPARIVIPSSALKSVGTTVPARLLGDDKDYQAGDEQVLRQALARWMTSPGNPYFARGTVNRLWAHFFGRGLANPVDDLRDDNPASHPELLRLLADELVKSEFDLKHVIGCICRSEAYQRSSRPLRENGDDRDKYSHMRVKVLPAGVFYDSLVRATGWSELKLGLPERKGGVTTLFTPREVFIDFYRSSQGQEADPTDYRHGIPQALKLLNARQLNEAPPAVERLARSGQSREAAVEQLYLSSLSRRPTADEAELMSDFLSRRKDAQPEQGYSAILWALINSSEFVLNH